MIRVALSPHLRTLAGVGLEVSVEITGTPTIAAVLDGLEAGYPMLRGTIRDCVSGARRPYMRFHGCGADLSHEPPDEPLPQDIAEGYELLRIVGAIAGG